MKKIALGASMLIAMVLPLAASAHEHDTFMIGGTSYTFVVGSLNEPLVVDDKTGLDLTVTKGGGMPTMGPDGDMDGPATASAPVNGLDSTLKLELIAGNEKKTMSISPQYGKTGAYSAVFYPTVATTFSYHLTGTIENKPVDLTFTCVPEGTPKAADDTTPLKISDSVTRTSHGGAFGCPLEKDSLGFPNKGASISRLSDDAQGARGIAELAAVLGLAGTILGGYALMRRKNS